MKNDILFMTWNCPDCALLKVEFEKFGIHAFEDSGSGKHGQNLIVIQTYSNVGARFVLGENDFGENIFTPVLKTYDKKKITDIMQIIKYLKENFK